MANSSKRVLYGTFNESESKSADNNSTKRVLYGTITEEAVLKEQLQNRMKSNVSEVKGTNTEKTLADKLYLSNAKTKKEKGEQLNVREIMALAKEDEELKKQGITLYETPQNSSQAYHNNKELGKINLQKYEIAIRSSEDFNDFYKKGYNIEKIPGAKFDKGLYKDIKNGEGIYKYLEPIEENVYYYLLGKGDNGKVREYILKKTSELESRKAADVADNNGVIENFAVAAGSGIVGTLMNMARAGASGSFTKGTIDGSNPLMNVLEPTYIEKLFQEVSKNREDRNAIYNLLLDATNSLAAQIPQLAFGAAGGYGAYIASMAAQSIGANTTEAIEQGYDGIRGVIYGVFDTALELSVEKILGGIGAKAFGSSTNPLLKKSLSVVDNVFSNKKVAKIFAKGVSTLFSANSEGVEEWIQRLLEPVLRNAIYGENNKIDPNTFYEAARCYLIGAISGFAMDVTYTGTERKLEQTRLEILGEELKQNLGVKAIIKFAEAMENTSNLYYEIKGDFNANREIEASVVAQLYRETATKFENPSNQIFKSIASKNIDNLIKAANEYTSNKHNNAENLALQSTTNAITNPISSYSEERQGVIKSFLNSVDEKLKSFVQSVKNGDTTFKRQKISDVSGRAATDIKNLLGIDVSGYTHNINSDSMRHILNRHGENGEYNSTMSSDDDIARMGWVLENYDTVELLTKDGKQVYSSGFMNKEGDPATQIRYIKRIDGTYYVVEAAFENDYKKLWVQSAYLQKTKEDVTRTAAEGVNTNRNANAQSASVSPSSNTTVPQNTQGVNTIISTEGENNTQADPNGPANFMPDGEFIEGERHYIYKKEQDYIKRICDKLGVKMEFIHITPKLLAEKGYKFEDSILPDGFFDKSTDTLYIGFTVVDPVKFIFKHELTHFGEGTEQYEKFVKAVTKSELYKQWLQKYLIKYTKNKRFATAKLNVLEESYMLLIANARGYDILENGQLSEKDEIQLKREMIADFVGDSLFTESGSNLEALMSNLNYSERKNIIRYILDFLSSIKNKLSKEKDLVAEISKLEDRFNRMLSEAVQTKNTPTEISGDLEFSIVTLDSGKSYVQASRRIITGNSVAEWRSQISEFFNNALKNGPIKIETLEGDVLTISKKTANKARDRNVTENGITRKLSDKEFLVKLHAESHIDELSELSKTQKSMVSDTKKHSFAKDGFTYRTVYFQDFDNSYYKVTLSVGENNGISTVYNVGKIKADDIPNGNIVSAIGSKADMSSANSKISQNQSTVNNNYTHENKNNSKGNLEFTFARPDNMSLVEKAEEMEKELRADGKKSEKEIREKIWKKTRLIRDSSGEWVYEILDNKMEVYLDGERLIQKDPDYEEYIKLENKEKWTTRDAERYAKLDDKFLLKYGFGTLESYIKHDELFKKYPQLKKYKVDVLDLGSDTKGDFNPKTKTIRINRRLIEDAKRYKEESQTEFDLFCSDLEVKEVFIHEIQHAVQDIENRENGASVEYWTMRLLRGTMPIDPETGAPYTPEKAYKLTKGEYEARQSADRSLSGKVARRQQVPDLGWDKTISAKEPAIAGNLKFSIPTNSEYMSAVESNDTAKLQQMVDNKARAEGYTERLYHQTGVDFNEFNTENQKAGKFDWELPTGTFLKPSNDDIGLEGKKQMELYAKIQNPLNFKDRTDAQRFWRKNVPGYKEAADEVIKIDIEYREKVNDATNAARKYLKEWKQNNPDSNSRDIYKDSEYLRLKDVEDSIADEWESKSDKASIEAKKLIDKFISENDYDGIVVEKDQDGINHQTKTYIVFNSNQLKDAAPVTYDNSGEVISLSQRFDSKQSDIRFSIPNVARSLINLYEKGEITKEEFNQTMQEEWDKVLSKYSDSLMAQRVESAMYGSKLLKRIKQKDEQLKKQNIELKRYNEEITPYGTLSFGENWRITKNVLNRIRTRRDTNSDKKHIPEGLKPYADKLLTTFLREDPMPFSSENLMLMKAMYEKFAGSEESAEVIGYDPEIAFILGELSESIDGKTIKELQFDELLCIRQVTENLWHMIKGKEEVFIDGKKQEIKDVGNRVLEELLLKNKKRGNSFTKPFDKVYFDNALPIYFFEKLGGTFKGLFDTLLDGEDKNQINVQNGKTFINNTQDKYNYAKWGKENLKPITTQRGEKISLSVEQAMLLYATYKREYLQQKDHTEHILEGGIVVPRHKTTFKEKIAEIQENFNKSNSIGISKLRDSLTHELNESAIHVSKTDIANIVNQLTPEQREYADSMVKYLSKNMAALGNQTSMEFFGYCKYNEKYYIPFCSAKNYLNVQIGTIDGNHLSIKHSSFTHKLSKGAKTPLVMGDFSEICADHIQKMSRYNASAVTLDAMLKILNYKSDNGKTVSTAIEEVYGKNALQYFKEFLQKMNGTMGKDDSQDFLNKLIGIYRKNAVSASLSVAIQQPTSLPRAMLEIDAKYFAHKSPKSDYEEMMKYCPVAGMKERGRVDIGTGTATVKWMLNQEPKNIGEKAKAFVDIEDSTYRDDKFMSLAAKGDEWTWRHIWTAVKREIADTTDLKNGTAEFFEACNKRFRYVVNKTQVYDSPISKSKIMSSKSSLSKAITAFAAESTVWINALTNMNKSNAAKVIRIYIISGALNAALKSFVTAPRDDDEEKTYLEKWLDDFWEAFKDNLNPLSLIPGARDVVSLFKGFDVERPDMFAITDVIDAYHALKSKNKSDYRKVEDFAGALAAFLGIPVKNIMRDMRAAYNSYKDIFVNDKEDRAVNGEANVYIDELADNKTFKSLEDDEKAKLEKKITDTVREVQEAKKDKKMSDKFDELYAELRKSRTSYNEMRKQMLEDGYTADEITNGVEIARIAYMKSIGIDVGEYLLYKIATSKKYADKDNSGGVTKEEKKKAVNKMDLDNKTKNYFTDKHK